MRKEESIQNKLSEIYTFYIDVTKLIPGIYSLVFYVNEERYEERYIYDKNITIDDNIIKICYKIDKAICRRFKK